jgi:hypothetical protein
MAGAELAAHLGRKGILVAAGEMLGEPQHVRIMMPPSGATVRLLDALEGLSAG